MNIIQRNDVNTQWSPSVSSRVQNSAESYTIPNPTCVNPGHEHLLAANKIGSAFALQYFQMAKTDPTELSRFYNFESHVCRIHPTASGVTEYYHAAGVEQINNLLIREYKDQPNIDVIYIRQLQCQMSLNGSVFVSIHGTYNYMDNTVMNFQQSAFLIPVKENENVGYSILNDILFYEQVKPENANSSVNASVMPPKLSYNSSSNKRNNSVVESVTTSTQNNGAVAKTFPSTPKNGPTNESLMYPASSVEMLEISEIFNSSGANISKNQTTLSRNVAITNIPTSEFSGVKTTNIEPEVSVSCICPESQFVQVRIENVQVDTTAPTINSAHSTVSSYEKISHKTNITSTSFETSNNNDTNSNKLTVAWQPQTANSNSASISSNRPPRTQRQNLDKKNTDSQAESHENPKKSFADAIKVMSQNKPIRKSGNEDVSSRSYSLKTKSGNNFKFRPYTDKDLKKFNELNSVINYPVENSRFNNTDRSALVSDRSNITDQSNEFININHSHKSMNKKLDSNNQSKGSLKNSGSVDHQRRPTGSDHNSNTGYASKKFNYASKHYDNKVLWTQIPKEVKGEKVKELLEEQMRLNNINGYIVEFNQYPSYALIEFDSEETAKQVLDLKLVVDDKIIPISIPRSLANNNGRQSPNYMNNRQKRDNYNHHNNRQQKQHSSNNNSYHRHSNSQNNGNVNNNSNNNYQKSSSFALNNTSSCTTEEGWTTAPNKRKYKTNSANRFSKKTMSRNKTIFEPTTAPVAQAV